MIASFVASPELDLRAHATVASRSDITCASGTFETTSAKICFQSAIFDTSPWRAYSSGAIAR